MSSSSNNNDKNKTDKTQELSETPRDHTARDECVGSLLIHQSDMQELSEAPPTSNLVRRVTEKVVEAIEKTEHFDPEDDALNWQCDV